jgi:glucosylglycerate synthase
LWSLSMSSDTRRELLALASKATREEFHLADELWVRIIYDFACAHRKHTIERGHLLRSLTPLYLARVASFVLETHTLFSAEVEEKIERLCRAYEELKPYLVANWTGVPSPAAPSAEFTAAGQSSGEPSHVVDVAENH